MGDDRSGHGEEHQDHDVVNAVLLFLALARPPCQPHRDGHHEYLKGKGM